MNILDCGITEFVELMRSHHTRRVWWIWDQAAATVRTSHPFLQEVTNWMCADSIDYQQHEGAFLQIGAETGTLQGAFVHNTVRG
nr:hypothetical protein [bacterium]